MRQAHRELFSSARNTRKQCKNIEAKESDVCFLIKEKIRLRYPTGCVSFQGIFYFAFG